MSHNELDRHHSDHHNQESAWKLINGDVDGSRPTILNETIARNYGGGSPTVFRGIEGGKWNVLLMTVHGLMIVIVGNHATLPTPPPPRSPLPHMSKRRQGSLSSTGSNSVRGGKRVKTRHALFSLSDTGEFSLSNELEDEAHTNDSEASIASTSTIVNVGSSHVGSVKSVADNTVQGGDLFFGIGSWVHVVIPTPIEDEGYVSGRD